MLEMSTIAEIKNTLNYIIYQVARLLHTHPAILLIGVVAGVHIIHWPSHQNHALKA